MALRSAATHLNVTRESGTFLRRFASRIKNLYHAAIRAKRMTCPTFSYGISKWCLIHVGLLRQMVLAATMLYSDPNAVRRGSLKFAPPLPF